MDDKLREIAGRHKVPLKFLQEALELERERIVLLKRRLVPKLVELVEKYASEPPAPASGGKRGD